MSLNCLYHKPKISTWTVKLIKRRFLQWTRSQMSEILDNIASLAKHLNYLIKSVGNKNEITLCN